MSSEKGSELPNEEAIKNLLIVQLLRDGVDPSILETATGVAEKTIRNKYPMKKVRGKS